MQWAEMIVLIVLIVTIGKIVQARTGDGRASRRANGGTGTVSPHRDDTDAAEAARLHGEIARLNDRIKVLERLATDPAKRLSDEIDALKDR